jgi:uncharacterized protein YehS (DUF1456 family)
MELGKLEATIEQAGSFRCKDDEPAYCPCPDAALLALLDGLMVDRRGVQSPSPSAAVREPAPDNGPDTATVTVTNNLVLKQLRIALSLRTEDVHELIIAGGGKISKTEVSAFFRNTQARNFRRCGDQVIRWLLAGLAAKRL